MIDISCTYLPKYIFFVSGWFLAQLKILIIVIKKLVYRRKKWCVCVDVGVGVWVGLGVCVWVGVGVGVCVDVYVCVWVRA